MKYWIGDVNDITLKEDSEYSRVISLERDGNKIIFREECDGYFSVTLTREAAIDALQEAIDWISNGL